MDRIELAERRFQQILPEPVTPWLGHRTREIEVWLRDDVVLAVEDFASRPEFRVQATWPLRRLVPGSDSAERRAVEAVDAALVISAAALARLAEEGPVAEALVEMNPPRERLVETQVVIRGDAPPERTGTRCRVDPLTLPWNQVRNISERYWTDLVCPHDYFQPRGGMMLKIPPPTELTEGAFVVSLNPELHPLGDFVTRCMVRRIELWRGCLSEFRLLCYPASSRAGQPSPALAEAEQAAWGELLSRESRLQALCLTGREARLRDSCIILTQAYSAFHPFPDLAWLNLPQHLVEYDRAVLRDRITGFRTSEPVERIATALRDLRQLIPQGAPRRTERDAAINAGGLVLIDRPRAAYWKSRRLDTDWDKNPKAWEFLRALVVKAQFSAAVSEADLYAESVGRSTMANRFRRLKKILPSTLWSRIIPADRGAYRLDLDRGQIHVFDAE